jgi:hypothetical protein
MQSVDVPVAPKEGARPAQRVMMQVEVEWHQCWDGRMEKMKMAGQIWTRIYYGKHWKMCVPIPQWNLPAYPDPWMPEQTKGTPVPEGHSPPTSAWVLPFFSCAELKVEESGEGGLRGAGDVGVIGLGCSGFGGCGIDFWW